MLKGTHKLATGFSSRIIFLSHFLQIASCDSEEISNKFRISIGLYFDEVMCRKFFFFFRTWCRFYRSSMCSCILPHTVSDRHSESTRRLSVMPNTHRRRRRDETGLSRRRRRCVLGFRVMVQHCYSEWRTEFIIQTNSANDQGPKYTCTVHGTQLQFNHTVGYLDQFIPCHPPPHSVKLCSSRSTAAQAQLWDNNQIII